MENTDNANIPKKSGKTRILALSAIVIVIAVFSLAFVFFQQNPLQNSAGAIAAPQISGPSMKTATDNTTLQNIEMQSDVIDPSQFILREDYFKEVFRPRRETYKLLEKAADFLKKPVSEVPAYFSLNSEEEIFSELPAPAADFSEIAYLLAQGRYFNLALLDETYYKQPEFYPNFKTLGVRYWTRPDPKYWVANGYGTYPAEQWDTLEKGKNEEFRGVVFFYAGWGVQTYQGISLRADTESQKYFDLEITPKTFLLEPTFAKFGKNWAYKVEITGKLKPDTPPGTYSIGINVEIPPRELRDKWNAEHPSLYFDGAGIIKASGNQIQLNITVK